MRIRPIRPEDHTPVGALTLRAYDASGGRISGDYRTALADPSLRVGGATEVLVAELDDGDHPGRVVGTVTFVLPGDTEWEDRPDPSGDCGFRILAVDPDVQGQGVGDALVRACLDRARTRGCRRMTIISMAWMTRAHELYRRHGFVRRPDLDVRFPPGIGYGFTRDLRLDVDGHFAPPGPVPDEVPWFEDAWRSVRGD